MNLKILHSEFELNLVDTSYTVVEENNWFSEQLFTKYTFPIKKTLTDDEIVALNFITEYAARNGNYIYDVTYIQLDEEHQAVMEIEKIMGRTIEFQVRFGFEEFPNFHKNLRDLPLHNFTLTEETIFEHALQQIPLTDADYNFPKILTNRFDKESDQWRAFEDYMNNYNGTVFLENEFDEEENLPINRNVMQPLPSLLYVLRTGFADAGYELKGDILSDPDYSRAFIYTRSEFYASTGEGEKVEWAMLTDEFELRYINTEMGIYNKSLSIPQPGRYRITGSIYLRGVRLFGAWVDIWGIGTGTSYDGQDIAMYDSKEDEQFFFLNSVFDVSPTSENFKLYINSRNKIYGMVGGTKDFQATIMDVTITKLAEYGPNGELQPTVIFPNEINLPMCVPDITFGELFKIIKLWKNYGISQKDQTIWVNLVKNEAGKGEIIDLSEKQVAEPERQTNQGKSFELGFAEFESEEYKINPIYIDSRGMKMFPYTKKEDTQEFIINALPLPLKNKNNILTAYDFLDDSRLMLVVYDGLRNGQNTTANPSGLQIPAIYENHYKEWFLFLLKTQTYLWDFVDYDINVRKLKPKSTVYAYGIHHIVKSLQKRNVAPEIIQVEIETHSIE